MTSCLVDLQLFSSDAFMHQLTTDLCLKGADKQNVWSICAIFIFAGIYSMCQMDVFRELRIIRFYLRLG